MNSSSSSCSYRQSSRFCCFLCLSSVRLPWWMPLLLNWPVGVSLSSCIRLICSNDFWLAALLASACAFGDVKEVLMNDSWDIIEMPDTTETLLLGGEQSPVLCLWVSILLPLNLGLCFFKFFRWEEKFWLSSFMSRFWGGTSRFSVVNFLTAIISGGWTSRLYLLLSFLPP